MLYDGKIWVATDSSHKPVFLLPEMANRHGLIAGATGTGKTVTLKVIAEGFSDMGVPVFLGDIKGDLSGMVAPGTVSEKIGKRLMETGVSAFRTETYPTVFWDVYGEQGHPIRATVSEMGPLLLSRMLNLNETQSGVLNILFRVAADENLPLYTVKDVKAMLDKYGLFAEFVAPRLWFDKRTNDGGFTASRKEDREFAQWRARRSCDIAKALGTNKIQLWLAREGTLCAEGKNPVEMTLQLRDAFNDILTYRDDALILVEPKPNEPIDRSICGTAGHALAVGAYTVDPSRVGLCIESAHSILAGLDPANDMGFALALNKLWGVHLNDQNGCRYDQDKSFGVDNLRNAFNQVKVLYENNYGDRGNFECVGLDVKAMRTQPDEDCYRHLINSKHIFELLLDKVKHFDYEFQAACVKEQNFEKLEMYVMELLMGIK